jgi:hypothetical protein
MEKLRPKNPLQEENVYQKSVKKFAVPVFSINKKIHSLFEWIFLFIPSLETATATLN